MGRQTKAERASVAEWTAEVARAKASKATRIEAWAFKLRTLADKAEAKALEARGLAVLAKRISERSISKARSSLVCDVCGEFRNPIRLVDTPDGGAVCDECE